MMHFNPKRQNVKMAVFQIHSHISNEFRRSVKLSWRISKFSRILEFLFKIAWILKTEDDQSQCALEDNLKCDSLFNRQPASIFSIAFNVIMSKSLRDGSSKDFLMVAPGRSASYGSIPTEASALRLSIYSVQAFWSEILHFDIIEKGNVEPEDSAKYGT